jgi:phosphohistidine swiveling domain-containing protein
MSSSKTGARKDQHMMDTALPFDELPAEGQTSAGGKGSTLARLYQAGYPVPDGLVILPSAFNDDELRPEAWARVQVHLARLCGNDPQAAFAVRSSALAEDSARASFAGEFETVLDVRSDEAVREAIGTVRRSRHVARVRAYGRARGAETDYDMAVVVQRLVQPDLSGNLFSADPVTGGRYQMSGNYVHGLGDTLVSGQATPHEFTLSRPRGRYKGPAALKRFARRLYKLARRLERDLGCPQDVEWAIARGKVYILQSRPITTLLGFDPVTGEYNDSLTGDYVWSCVNVGEALSVVMTPYTWSVMRRAFGELDVLPGYASVGNIGGRLYQNATVAISVLGALGQNVEDMVTEVGGVREEYLETLDQYLVPVPEATFLTILPGAIRMWRKQRAALRNLETFLAGNPGWCRAMCRRIEAIGNGDELATLVMDEFSPRSLESFWRNYATILRYGELVGKLRRELMGLVGPADADALLSNVSRQGELLASLGPVVGLARLARGEMSRETYLARWGHRGPLEAEVSVPRPFEDPDWLDRQLAAWAESTVDVEALLAGQRAEFDAAWERFCTRYPRRVKSMRRRLDRAAEAARQREAARSESTRLLWVSRTWVLRAGALTGIGDDVFFLSLHELLDLLAGRDLPLAAIPARRQTYERYKALPPYPLLIRGRFDPFQWAADPDRRDDVFDSHGLLPTLTLKAPAENMILGMPGSAGQVEGRVRRLDRPEDGNELEPGEILVTKQTNIGWTLFFPRAGAVVTDVGAPLSHAAVVARELGIPAVVNCGDATARLHTGDRVRVDGVTGVVEILGAG